MGKFAEPCSESPRSSTTLSWMRDSADAEETGWLDSVQLNHRGKVDAQAAAVRRR